MQKPFVRHGKGKREQDDEKGRATRVRRWRVLYTFDIRWGTIVRLTDREKVRESKEEVKKERGRIYASMKWRRRRDLNIAPEGIFTRSSP